MQRYPKEIKRLLRRLADIAYERELGRELATLEAGFAEWRSGGIDSFELSARIHRYEMGVSRELYSYYGGAEPALQVARALREGLLARAELPGEVLAIVEPILSLWEQAE